MKNPAILSFRVFSWTLDPSQVLLWGGHAQEGPFWICPVPVECPSCSGNKCPPGALQPEGVSINRERPKAKRKMCQNWGTACQLSRAGRPGAWACPLDQVWVTSGSPGSWFAWLRWLSPGWCRAGPRVPGVWESEPPTRSGDTGKGLPICSKPRSWGYQGEDESAQLGKIILQGRVGECLLWGFS